MDDLTTRAAKMLWSKLPHPQTCPDEIDEAARAVVALVLGEVAKKVKDHAKILPNYKCPDDECADPTEQGYGNACHNIEHMLRALWGAVMSAPELKPCPFCGGKANGGFFPGDYDISCEACEFSISRHVSDCGSEEEAEYSAIAAWNRRADLARAKVKPLVWEPQGKTFIADHGAGHYIVCHDFDGWRWILVNGRDMAGVAGNPFDEADAAKAAAQADYEARILAALVPARGVES